MTLIELTNLTATASSGLTVRLTPFDRSEARRVYELCQDPEIPRWTTVPSPYGLADAEAFVDSHRPSWNEITTGSFNLDDAGPELTWAVRVDPPDHLAGLWGSLGLMRRGAGVVEVGWWLGAGARGHGIIRAAVARIVRAAFDPDLPIQASRVIWHAAVGNLASARIAQRTGFRYTGVVPHPHCGQAWEAVIDPTDPVAPRGDWPALDQVAG